MTNVSLPNATDKDGQYIHISQVTSGLKDDLMCPYCRGILVAKKGDRMAHHFAHYGETCFDVTNKDFNELDVPLYDRFNLYISATAWNDLLKFHNTNGKFGRRKILLQHKPSLIKLGFGFYGSYEKTNEGKVPFGEATLNAFSDFQLGHVYARHNKISEAVQLSYFGKPRFRGFGITQRQDGYLIEPAKSQTPHNIVDLNIYRSQVMRLFQLDLYLLKIETANETLFKIGVSRDVDRRVDEIRRDLKPYLDVTKISIDRLCRNRGAVERYAHHRYSQYKVEIGFLTEYFQFDKKTLANVRRDFTSLGDCVYFTDGKWYKHDYYTDEVDDGNYEFEGLIGQILAGEKSWVQQVVEKDQLSDAISVGTKKGMQKAKERGIHVGRPAEGNSDILNKYPEIAQALSEGKGLREIAREFGVSRNTVRKVRDAMN